jgi:hypothetical protein
VLWHALLITVPAYFLSSAFYLAREKMRYVHDQSRAVADAHVIGQLGIILFWPLLDLRLVKVLPFSVPAVALITATGFFLNKSGENFFGAWLGCCIFAAAAVTMSLLWPARKA